MSSNLFETPTVGDTSCSPGRRGKSRRLCKEKDGQTYREIHVQEKLPLPRELMSHTLLYLDAETLFQAFQVSQVGTDRRKQSGTVHVPGVFRTRIEIQTG